MSLFAANVKVSNQIRHECAIERVSETRNAVTPDPQCFISSVNEGVQIEVLIEFFHLVTTVEYCDMTVPHDLTMPPPYDAKVTEELPNALPARIWITDSRITVPLSDHPTACICPYCHQAIVTRVEKSNGAIVWLAAAAICLLGFVIGCCLIPFCIDEMKDKKHFCPHCQRMIGEKRKL